MARINFGGVEEEVVTRDEFTLDHAREVLKNEVVAVLGYGVQGPAQALNMKEYGIHVIVGQRENSPSWEKALRDGWKPGETLFSLEEAAERGKTLETRESIIFFSWVCSSLFRSNRSCPSRFCRCDSCRAKRIRYQCS